MDTHPLHQVGTQVAAELGLRPDEVTRIAPPARLPAWRSNLRVGELAMDSVALASLAMALVADARGATAGAATPGDSHRSDAAATRRSNHAGEDPPGAGTDAHPNQPADVASGSIQVDPDRVAASFGSERLFRLNGVAPQVWAPLSGFWEAADGWVRTHGNYPHHAERLRALLGVPKQADRDEVAAAIRRRSRLELEDAAAERGALVFAVRAPEEWRAHPQSIALNGTPLLHIDSHGDAAPRPWRGEATAAEPLVGIRVLDLTRVIAGPVATRDLALAGADVLRVDSPDLPEIEVQYLDTGQGKRSTLLNLRDASDRRDFERLLAGADVLVHGYRPNALAQFGLDAATLHDRHPGLVVAQLSAWGTTGPWGARRGFDSLVQAASGIAVLESPDGGLTPGALPVQALDHSTGHFLAAAIAAALRTQRARGGSPALSIALARVAAALLAAGAPERPDPDADTQPADTPPPAALPTVRVPILPATASDTLTSTVECAPPALAYLGAPIDYPTQLHPYGSDAAQWRR